MTQQDIIRMAREAGIFTGGHPMCPWSVYPSDLERFAALVAAAEREACARVCEDDCGNGALNLADAIRARGQSTPDCPPCHGDCNQGRTCPARAHT